MTSARSVVLVSICFAFAAGHALGETDAERKQRHEKALKCAEAESIAGAASRPIDRPFAVIQDTEELLFFRHTTGTSGNPGQSERVEITEYVGAKTGRRYACRVSGSRPETCIEIVIPGSACLQGR